MYEHRAREKEAAMLFLLTEMFVKAYLKLRGSNVNTDAYYAIGKSHAVCQDYAAVVRGEAVVADGCSSSPHTDIGARIVVHGARGKNLQALGLPDTALDATRIGVQLAGGGFRVVAWGDGIIVARRRDGSLQTHSIVYPSGAPFYENYLSDEARLERYKATFGMERQVTWESPTGHGVVYDARACAYEATFPLSDYDLVLVGSDGWLSGMRPVGSATSRTFENVPLPEVVAELTAFKGMTGAFLQRRMRRMLENWAKNGWFFYDDVSAAAIYVSDTPGLASTRSP